MDPARQMMSDAPIVHLGAQAVTVFFSVHEKLQVGVAPAMVGVLYLTGVCMVHVERLHRQQTELQVLTGVGKAILPAVGTLIAGALKALAPVAAYGALYGLDFVGAMSPGPLVIVGGLAWTYGLPHVTGAISAAASLMGAAHDDDLQVSLFKQRLTGRCMRAASSRTAGAGR